MCSRWRMHGLTVKTDYAYGHDHEIEAVHVPVLPVEVVEWLAIRPEGIYVDCTAGGAGHSTLIARKLAGGRLIALDRDPASVELARRRLAGFPRAEVIHRNYGELAEALEALGIAEVDGILIDAGFSSMQLEDPRRGFTFQEEGPLDMRLDPSGGLTAAEWLARTDEAGLARALREYGDVGPARRIARSILARRASGAMRSTSDLAQAVHDALAFVQGMPEETRTVFQAIRIAVNEEYRWLEAGVRQGIDALKAGGRIVAIAFHSGEDRIVKHVFQEASRARRELHADGRVKSSVPPRIRVLTPKPQYPSEEEIERNPRAHSARLRAAEKI